MTGHNHETDATRGKTEKTKSRRVSLIVAGTLAIMALGGLGVATAMSDGGPGRFVSEAAMRHGGHFAGHGLDRALAEVDATAEQEDRIHAIIDDARSELRPLMREFRDARESVIDILKADTIDRDAVETLRAERVAAIDEASKKLTAAVLEAADVLTPEQRAELVEHFGKRGSRR